MDLETLAPQSVIERLGRHQEFLICLEDTLREERLEYAKLIDEVRVAMETPRGANDQLDELRALNEHLRRMCTEQESVIAALHNPDTGKVEELEQEVATLRQQLQEKQIAYEELSAARTMTIAHSSDDPEAADYEAELNEFRRQLEADRQSLDAEIKRLRARNTELHEAAREAELEMSRERASLARERAQLDRLREELKQELERAQRNAGVQEYLAPVTRLKEEMAERNRLLQQGNTPPPDNKGILRWRGAGAGSTNKGGKGPGGS